MDTNFNNISIFIFKYIIKYFNDNYKLDSYYMNDYQIKSNELVILLKNCLVFK